MNWEEAGKYMSMVRSDIEHATPEYCTELLRGWAERLSGDEWEVGSSWATLGFELVKAEDGGFDLNRKVFSFYEDETDFDWRTSAERSLTSNLTWPS